MKNSSRNIFVASTMSASALLGSAWLMGAQPGSSQPGTPSKQPAPKNPSPRPQPRPTQPNQPNQPNQPTQPATPGTPDGNPNVNTPLERNDPNAPINRQARVARPFMFQTPQSEAAFNQSVQQLLRSEQRLEQNNQTLLRRLGEVRQMPADRQNAAMFDLVQQLLLQQQEQLKLMALTRTAFTGDVDLDTTQAGVDETGLGPPSTTDNPRK